MTNKSISEEILGNTNFIGNDNILYNIYVGNQSLKQLQSACNEIAELIQQLKKRNKKVLVLTDITKLESVNLKARLYAIEFVRSMDFDKVAIYGNNSLAQQMIKIIINASGKTFNMRYFFTEREAKDWLLQR
jgi:hypothetical protein